MSAPGPVPPLDEHMQTLLRLQVLQEVLVTISAVDLWCQVEGASRPLTPPEVRARFIEAVASLVTTPGADGWQRAWNAIQMHALREGLSAENVLMAWAVGLQACREEGWPDMPTRVRRLG